MEGQFGAGPYVGGGTTTTTTTQSTAVNTSLRFDKEYLRSIPGMLKAVVMVINIIAFICVSSSDFHYHSNANWMSFCAWAGFFTTGTLLLFYCLHLIEKFHFIPWLLVEFIYCAVWSFFFFSASCACASYGKASNWFAAAAFFGFCSCLLYGLDAYMKFVDWRAGRVAQGERIVTTTTVASTPAY
ncbi:CKLF-like MARVEL transmembrane domain-containing protein 8 [Artemia franciscana]|uniref:MARVEL domain-containing protein n=1 Tax=Artemia franciscana TaxID=6661 RepID=A0AA88LGG6_ARTSF|nr:hypothetical protein QYM36_001977 [Artemia franciscana]